MPVLKKEKKNPGNKEILQAALAVTAILTASMQALNGNFEQALGCLDQFQLYRSDLKSSFLRAYFDSIDLDLSELELKALLDSTKEHFPILDTPESRRRMDAFMVYLKRILNDFLKHFDQACQSLKAKRVKKSSRYLDRLIQELPLLLQYGMEDKTLYDLSTRFSLLAADYLSLKACAPGKKAVQESIALLERLLKLYPESQYARQAKEELSVNYLMLLSCGSAIEELDQFGSSLSSFLYYAFWPFFQSNPKMMFEMQQVMADLKRPGDRSDPDSFKTQ